MGGAGFAVTWDELAARAPGRVALSSGGYRVTWGELSERANRLAWHLRTEARLEAGDRVAIALGNQPEYLETFYAALKLGCVPVNVDLAHGVSTVHAVLDHSDAKAAVHCGDHTKLVKAAAKRIPKPWRPFLLATGEPYERAVLGAPSSGEWQPAGVAADELVLIYNGGAHDPTTAVVWRGADLCAALRASLEPSATEIVDGTVLPVAPLTHSLGLLTALQALIAGAAVALTRLDPFQPGTVWDAVEQERVTTVSIVSDASARQLAEALRAEPERWDLSRLRTVTCATRVRAASRGALTELLPTTEVAVHDNGPRRVGPMVRVVDDSGRDVEPGSGTVGLLAIGGAIPLGYYKDAAKTSSQFRTIDGSRYWVSGEFATVDDDGVLRSARSGAAVIRVAGRPVSAIDVEAELRKHASVADCVAVGVPGPRSGERLVALVEVVDRHYLDEAEMTAWCRTRLGAHETPSRFLFVESVGAAVGGRVNRVAARRIAIEMLERESG